MWGLTLKTSSPQTCSLLCQDLGMECFCPNALRLGKLSNTLARVSHLNFLYVLGQTQPRAAQSFRP